MDTRLQSDLQRLTARRAGVAALEGAQAPETIPDQTGTSSGQVVAAAPASSGTIASPLIETSRTYHATKAISSDGLFTWSVPASITMTDANGQTVVFNYAAPA